MYEEFNGTGRSLKGLQNEGSYYTTWSSVIKGLSQNTWYHHHPVTSGISHFWQNFPFSSKSTPYPPPHTHFCFFKKKKNLTNAVKIQLEYKSQKRKQVWSNSLIQFPHSTNETFMNCVFQKTLQKPLLILYLYFPETWVCTVLKDY